MSRGIFLVHGDGQLVEMKEQPYDSEDLLQGYLATYPNLLVGDQINPGQPLKWLLVTREASVLSEEGGGARWSVDHLFLDQNAVPTIVEVKRSSDTRIRREVVGQMLDYAANAVVYWQIEALRSQFEKHWGENAEQQLFSFLGADSDPEQFWQQVKTNLQAGKVRLIFVADIIPVELRRIVEFLNEQMDPAEVLAVEIKQYSGEGLKTFVPTVMGLTAEAQQRKYSAGGSKKKLTEEDFFQAIEARRGSVEAKVARKILEWARPRATEIWWGTASYVPVLNTPAGIEYQLFAVYTRGAVETYFQTYQNKPKFKDEAKRMELLNKLNSVEGINIPPDGITRYPAIPLAVLSNENSMAQFLKVYEWFIGEITNS
jgi:hypothetical protein